MDLSIIIVSWKVKEKVRANLSALFKSNTNFKFEVYLVDNNSLDGTVEMVKKDFPLVKIIANSDNKGFSRANNQALKLAQGRFILLLNPDMLLKSDTLDKILKWSDKRQEVTVSSCRLIDEQGKNIKHVRRFPKLLDQLAIILKLPHLFPKIISKYLMIDFNYELAQQVDSVRGSFFLINLKNYQKISKKDKPFLDERYFIWFEEVDFCREVYQFGGQVWYTPVTECFDYLGSSFKQIKRIKGQKYFRDSMLKYFKKWRKKWEYIILKIAWDFIMIFV